MTAGWSVRSACSFLLLLTLTVPVVAGERQRTVTRRAGTLSAESSALTACDPPPGPVDRLLAVRRGSEEVELSWQASPGAEAYNVWKVDDGSKELIPLAHEVAAPGWSSIREVCRAATDPTCTDSDPAPPSTPVFYQVRGACRDGSEGPDLCAGAAQVWVAAHRVSVPDADWSLGECDTPDLLPINVQAIVFDAGGAPLANCAVLFRTTMADLPFCAEPFAELCVDAVAETDSGGVAEVTVTVSRADLERCNCLAALAGCPYCRGTCADFCVPPREPYFCGIGVEAAAGPVRSRNIVIIEYGA